MFGQFTGQQKPDGGLDLPGGDGGPLVVVSKTGSLSSDTFEDIVDERVHDAHGLGGDTSIGMDLFQHLVDVDGVGFLPFAVLFLISLGDVLLGLSGLLGGFSRNFGRHVESWLNTVELIVRQSFGPLYISNRALRVRIEESSPF